MGHGDISNLTQDRQLFSVAAIELCLSCPPPDGVTVADPRQSNGYYRTK